MLTREQAEMIVKEAIEQGWADKANDEEYRGMDAGSIDWHDWDEVNRRRVEIGNDPFLNTEGCTVELRFPGMYSSEKYWIGSTEDWRKLKSKVDELKQIILEINERGWSLAKIRPTKSGKHGMYIEVVPPGGSRVYPERVGGMRTWRKLCRDYDSVIDQQPEPKQIER